MGEGLLMNELLLKPIIYCLGSDRYAGNVSAVKRNGKSIQITLSTGTIKWANLCKEGYKVQRRYKVLIDSDLQPYIDPNF